MAHSRGDASGFPSYSVFSVYRSNYFLDSDGLDISERLGGNAGAHHLLEIPNGLIPDLLRAMIPTRQKIRWLPFTPKDDEIDLAIPTRTLGFRELLFTDVLINPISRRMRRSFPPLRNSSDSDRFTDYPSGDSPRIAVLRHGLIDGCSLSGSPPPSVA